MFDSSNNAEDKKPFSLKIYQVNEAIVKKGICEKFTEKAFVCCFWLASSYNLCRCGHPILALLSHYPNCGFQLQKAK